MSELERQHQEELRRIEAINHHDDDFFGFCSRCTREFNYGQMRRFYPKLHYFDVRIDYKCPDCNNSIVPF